MASNTSETRGSSQRFLPLPAGNAHENTYAPAAVPPSKVNRNNENSEIMWRPFQPNQAQPPFCRSCASCRQTIRASARKKATKQPTCSTVGRARGNATLPAASRRRSRLARIRLRRARRWTRGARRARRSPYGERGTSTRCRRRRTSRSTIHGRRRSRGLA